MKRHKIQITFKVVKSKGIPSDFTYFVSTIQDKVDTIDELKPDLFDIELLTGTAIDHYTNKAIKYSAIDLLGPIVL